MTKACILFKIMLDLTNSNMMGPILLLTLISLVPMIESQTIEPLDPNIHSRTLNIITQRGFIGKAFRVRMPNGYPLVLYRIINPLADPERLNKYPVLYGHGIMFDSSSMISRSGHSRPRKPVIGQPTILNEGPGIMEDDHSLPFMFSNNNFDVWLFDSRGSNTLSRNESIANRVNPLANDDFWDFSLDEEGLIDVPLYVNLVLGFTKSEKVIYVGYSESTFYIYGLLSTHPEYASKFAAIVCMAPVAYVAHAQGLVKPLIGPLMAVSPDSLKINFAPQQLLDAIDTTVSGVCGVPGVSKIICGPIANSVGGFGSGQMNPDFFAKFLHGTSIRAMKHFYQLLMTKRCGMFDYGPMENLRRYGQINPPNYDLSRIRTDRLILVRGTSDFLSTPEDQERLIRELGMKPYLDIVIPQFNHFDFIDGKNLVNLVNGPVMRAVHMLMYQDGPNIIKPQLMMARL